MDDERTGISQGEVVSQSQPHFEMGERTIPIKHLNDEGKDKSGEMTYLHNLILDSPQAPQKEKDDPEKMDQHHAICKNLVEHILFRLSQATCLGGFILSTLSRSFIFLNKNDKKRRMNCRGVNRRACLRAGRQALFVRSLG
jgi:hypothetical protein